MHDWSIKQIECSRVHVGARKRQETRGIDSVVEGKVDGRRGIVENNESDFIYIVHFIQELTTTLLKKNA